MKKSVIVLWVVAALLLIGSVQLFTSNIPAAVFGIVAAAVLAFVGFTIHKKHKAAVEQATHEQAEKEAARRRFEETHAKLVFSVAGVTFKNEDGKSRQAILKRKMKEDEDGVVIVSLGKYDYEGKPAVAVYIDDEQVGVVPNSDLPEVLSIMDKKVTGLHANIEAFDNEDDKKVYRCDIAAHYEK
jgi:hypothetical protein